MSQFKQLLRQSKVVSLPPAGLKITSKNVPKQQVLQTTSSSHHRRNWGIKANLPQAAKSTYLTYEKLENDLGFPQVEYGAPFARRMNMFQELGGAVDLPGQGEFSSLLQAGPRPARTLATISPKQRSKLVDAAKTKSLEFKDGFKRRSQQSTTSFSNLSRAEEFMGLTPSVHGTQQSENSAIGLSYALKGALHNTPRGLVKSRPVRARVLPRTLPRGYGQAIAVGGFVGRLNARTVVPESVVSHQRPVSVVLDRAVGDSSGSVNLSMIATSNSSRAGRPSQSKELEKSLDGLIGPSR